MATRRKAKAKKPTVATRKARFLEVLRQTANVSRSAREAGLSSSTVYSHRSRYAGFARDWDAALAEALDELEAEMLDRARRGVEKPVYYQGKQVGSVRNYSDALGIFLLKAKRPEIYNRASATAAELQNVEEMTQEEAKAEVMRRLDRLAAHDAE